MIHTPRILVVAGSDSSGGAGIQADIKTITLLGGYAMTAITALTAQNTQGVTRVVPVAPEMVAAQIDACLSDIGADAVKIGMLGSAEVAEVLAERLQTLDVPIVFDPVMVASSGAALADPATIVAFERLMRMATLTTPNVAELAALGGHAGMRDRGVTYLAKGGDAEGGTVTDSLHIPGQIGFAFQSPRIVTRHTHGTGCTLASAIATALGHGVDLLEAIQTGRAFVHAALEAAPGFGSGNGPLGHHAVR